MGGFLSRIDPIDLSLWAWLVWLAYWLIASRLVKATKSSEGWAVRMQHLIPLAVGFFLIFHHRRQSFVYPRLYHSITVEVLGAAVTVAGLLFAVWGRVHLGKYWSGIITLKEGHELIRTGPYQYVRHPLYTGFLLAVLGSALSAATGDAALGFVVILVAYLVKMHREESVLTREFGDQYRRFKTEVPALLPFFYRRRRG